MSIVNFSPKVWAAQILDAKETNLAYGSDIVINRDYEGEIAQVGDTVRILEVGDPTISDYTKDADIAAPETLTDATLELKIDQAKVFNFAVDDVDKRQARGSVIMQKATARAGYRLAKVQDSFIASLYTDVATANLIGDDTTPKADLGTAGAAYAYIVDLNTRLDECDVPEEGRWIVVPAWAYGLLEKDSRFTGYGTAENRATIKNGVVGDVSGCAVIKSNQVPNTSGAKFKILAGHKEAWSLAEQILETEAYRPERRFGDAVKGLNVYGAKVVRPDSLVCLTANRP